jgi:membrane fusion protein (multidrug efflux system)
MKYFAIETNELARSALGKPLLARASRKSHFQIAIVFLIFGTLFSAGCEKKQEASAGPPDVQVIEVVQRDVQISKTWVATLNGLINAQIRAQVAGYLIKQTYTNGANVQKGTPLFQIDPRSFQADLNQAQSKFEQAKADLEAAKARYGKTQLDVARYTPLAKQSAISQQELDDAIQNDLAAKAQVQAAEANIAAAKAAADSAQLNLGFTSIVSPIDGVAGIASAQLGDYVGPQSAALTTVSTVNPILANFTPSEQEYLNAMKQTRAPGLSEEEALHKLEWKLALADGSTYPLKGRFYALDREVDVRTGSILVQIEFPNPGNVLRPGGFANIDTVVRTQRDALLVPQRAVSDIQGNYLMAVVDSENKVTIHPVKVGPRIGSMWVIDEGLKPGDRVIAEGVQKVKEGSRVNPKPYEESQAEAKPSA